MKTCKTLILGFLILFLGIPDLSAQDDFSKGIGIAMKASTEGIGGDAVFNFHKRMSVRLGYEGLAVSHDFSFQEQTIQYNATATYKTGSISLLFDYYLLNNIFVTAGAGWNLFDAVVDGGAASAYQYGDIQIPKEKVGVFNFQITPSNQVSPYLGIGFGRTLGLKRKLGFSFELGGFYQGSPKIAITSTGLLSPTSNPDQQQATRLERQFSQYSVYPVLKFSLSYKIAKL